MADPSTILPDQYEILATRVLRGAGLTLDHPRMLEPASSTNESADYALRLISHLHTSGGTERLLIECRRNREPVGLAELDALADHFHDHRIAVFATGGYDANASGRATELGIALYRVTDAKAGYSGWGFAGQIPSWLPEFSAERIGGAPLPDGHG